MYMYNIYVWSMYTTQYTYCEVDYVKSILYYEEVIQVGVIYYLLQV